MICFIRDARPKIRLARAAIIAILIALLAEFLLANAQRLFVYSKDDYLPLDGVDYSALPPGEDGSYRIAPGQSLNYSDLPGGIFSISFRIRYQDEAFLAPLPAPTVKITASDPRTSWESDGFITVVAEQIAIGEGGNTKTVTLYASVKSEQTEKLRISFSDLPDTVIIDSVRFNDPPAWTLSPLRALLITLLILLPSALTILGLRSEYDPDNLRHRIGIRSAVLVTVLFSMFFLSFFLGKNEEIPYPLTGAIRYYQPYVQQFDAFLKGQLHLDVPVSDEMLGLENPYDYDSRVHASPLWDRAYYDGKYYSYFGIAPILIVYYPYYLVTGAIAGDSFVLAVFLLLSAIFLPLTVIHWAELHERNRIPLPLLWVGAVTAFLGSMMPLIARSVSPFYYIATLAGNAFLALFLYLLLKATAADSLRRRCAFYALAGVAYGLLLHSRLNIALLAAFIVLPYLLFRVILRRTPSPVVAAPAVSSDEGDIAPEDTQESESPRREGIYKKLFTRLYDSVERPKPLLFSLLSLGAPVAVALLALLLLNYLRFDSPFEFGTTYQLTVSDISYNTLSLGNLFPALYHYFFQKLNLSHIFPYLSLTRITSGDYGHYVYIDTGLGLFSLPLMNGLLLSPAVLALRKRSAYEKALLVFALIGVVVIVLLNFSLGGVIFRYTADVTSLTALMSVFSVFALYTAFAESREENGARAAYVAFLLFFLVSIVTSLLLSISYNANLTKYPANYLVAIRDFFTFR